MIVFGSCVGFPEKWRNHAASGLEASLDDDGGHFIAPMKSNGREIFSVYADLMMRARNHRAECLVLMHDDLEFRDPQLAAKLRAAFADPTVAIVGLIGARHVTSLRWWQGDRAGRVEDTGYGVHDFGFRTVAAYTGVATADVDTVDGMMIALSPWALENLTLEGLGYAGFHGYDADLCFQARDAGKRVIVADIAAFHHSKGGFTQGLEDAEAVFQKRWRAARVRPTCEVCHRERCEGHFIDKSLKDYAMNKIQTTHVYPPGPAGLWPSQMVDRDELKARYAHPYDADKAAMAKLVAEVRAAGTDSLSHFGNGYTHEGGLYLQQNPEEFAALAMLLADRHPGGHYLEIGSASGGAGLFLSKQASFHRFLSIDDGKHPRASSQREHFARLGNEFEQFVGDSHSAAAREWLDGPPFLDVAFIDGDHSYEGVTADIALVMPYLRPGASVVLHDIVACEGVKRAWAELLARPGVRLVAEYVGAEKPLGIGVAEYAGLSVVAATEGHVPSAVTPRAQYTADPWAPLRNGPGPWSVEQLTAMYDAARGAPVSSDPMVMMVVPSYREGYDIVKLCNPSREAVIEDLLSHGISACRLDIDGDSLVQRMRQRAMHQFLKTPATHLLWCDLDIEVRDPTCVRAMLRSGFDIVGGACPFKNVTRGVVVNFLPTVGADLDRASINLPHGCLEVHDVGTGFQLVSRRAILQMMAAHPELLHWSRSHSDNGEPLWALYDTGVIDGTYESEDFMFCRYWQQLGGRVYVYVPATFRHYGTHGFEASIMEQLGLEQA